MTNNPDLIDALLDPVPEGAEPVAFVMRWAPVVGEPSQERRLVVGDISPGDDRLAVEMTGRAVLPALQLGPPTIHMVVWFVAGRQMRLRRESWRALEHLFTVANLDRCELLLELDRSDKDETMADPTNLDDVELGDREDPTQGPNT